MKLCKDPLDRVGEIQDLTEIARHTSINSDDIGLSDSLDLDLSLTDEEIADLQIFLENDERE